MVSSAGFCLVRIWLNSRGQVEAVVEKVPGSWKVVLPYFQDNSPLPNSPIQDIVITKRDAQLLGGPAVSASSHLILEALSPFTPPRGQRAFKKAAMVTSLGSPVPISLPIIGGGTSERFRQKHRIKTTSTPEG